jgi:aspartyl-tRNA(Asn)/glutamyl-tRNA(Gln) amidotransferase subunit A
MTGPADLSLAEAADALFERTLSPVELTEACLARVRRLDPVLQAFTALDEAAALEEARVLGDELARGHYRSRLHGIPVAIKDLIDVAGWPTTASSRVLAGNVATGDAPIVARLRAGGATVIGKTNTQEFAYGVVTAPTLNPWDTTRIPGGSSGGSAVALAAGMALGALGSDTAGSIRIPASLCGVSGLRPRRDALPMEGVIPLSWTLDSCGPMARSAIDLDLMWTVLTESKRASARWDGLRLATPEWESLGEVDPEVGDAVEEAIQACVVAGATRSEVALPQFERWDRPRNVFLASEALAAHQEAGWYPEKADAYGPETLRSLRHAETISASKLVAARRTLESLARHWFEAFRDADLLALPTTPVAAPRIEDLARMQGSHFRPEVVVRLTRLCGPVNWCDLAAVSVPCGFTAAGLPIGLQLVARDETTALTAALAYQSVTEFHTRRPPLSEPA